MDNRFFDHPILNSPYESPARHWELDEKGQPTQQIIESRRRAKFITPIPKPRKRKGSAEQGQLIFDAGKGFLEHIVNANNDANPELMCLALKLATGAGKTTVMAMLIAWHTINAVRRPNSKKFTRGFLLVTPGITFAKMSRRRSRPWTPTGCPA